MTVCNMSIEAGARAGMIAPDETTFDYLRGREFAPQATSTPPSPAGGSCRPTPARSTTTSQVFRRRRHRAASHLGHQPRPGRAGRRQGAQPGRPRRSTTSARRPPARWSTWASTPARRSPTLTLDRVFIGSCTNARIEDLRAAAAVVRGHHVLGPRARDGRPRQRPGEAAGRSRKDSTASSRRPASNGARPAAACAWRMNPDKLAPGERCASTSNRNFEGRQGKGGRTHLVSPAMAAAAAVAGHFVDIREWEYK